MMINTATFDGHQFGREGKRKATRNIYGITVRKLRSKELFFTNWFPSTNTNLFLILCDLNYGFFEVTDATFRKQNKVKGTFPAFKV